MLKTLTKKQQGFVNDYLATGNASLAVKGNYSTTSDSVARSIGSENLTKPNIQRTIADALDAQGLTNDHLAAKVAELVNAQRKITVLRNGEFEAVEERIDTPAVKAGLDFVFKLKEPALKGDAGNFSLVSLFDRLEAIKEDSTESTDSAR